VSWPNAAIAANKPSPAIVRHARMNLLTHPLLQQKKDPGSPGLGFVSRK
jgi:hypothetical protein